MKEFYGNYKKIFISIISVFFLVGGVWFYFHKSNDTIWIREESNSTIMEEENGHKESFNPEKESQTPEQPREIMVHITGQVKNPGVIVLEEGKRLIDAINKLGGATEEADLERVNLAQKLVDEQQIYIPKKGEGVSSTNDSISLQPIGEDHSNKININVASQEELKSLPGIGDVLSKNIIEYRETHGGFKSIEEIKEVNRIGDKIFNDIKDKIGI